MMKKQTHLNQRNSDAPSKRQEPENNQQEHKDRSRTRQATETSGCHRPIRSKTKWGEDPEEEMMFSTKYSPWMRTKQGASVLDQLKSVWHNKDALVRLQDVVACVVDILEHFEDEKLKGGKHTRNPAIDAVIQLLQSEKN